MTQPIAGYSRNPYDGYTRETHDAATPAQQSSLDMCRKADTVLEGFICGEPQVTAQACRKPTNAADEFVCDDKKMAAAQHTVWDTTKDILKALLGAAVGKK